MMNAWKVPSSFSQQHEHHPWLEGGGRGESTNKASLLPLHDLCSGVCKGTQSSRLTNTKVRTMVA